MKNAKETIVLMLCLSLIFSPSAAFAAPQGGKVVGGSANIHQSGATTTINQSSDRAIINWHSFDIGKNEAVRHNMPSRNSAGLHRVVGGGGASQIQGLLQSNGNVYLVNPAGVVIHKGARVDTNGFIATTRDIADSNFMNDHMVFDKPGRPDAQIINQGSISVKESGLAALVAPTVRNEGLIAGKLGKVALASGDTTWKLDMHGDDLITFTVDEKNVNALHAADGTPLAGVENSGSIKAEGGVVVLTAAQLDGIVGSVVNSGEVSAASAEFKGGKITFKGQGSDVDIVNTGMVDVSSAVADGGMVRMDTDGKTRSSGIIAATGGQKGGKVTLTGREVALSGTSKIDASGNTGGGTALVGGNALGQGPERNAQKATVEREAAIYADAKIKGDGGQVVVWSDEKTTFDGTITAKGGNEGGNGGQVETSGKSLKVGDKARVNTLAPQGKAGEWLLDPEDFIIAANGGDMTGAQLSSNLASSNVEIKSESGGMAGNGDIFVNDAISWSADTMLTLTADRNVNVNANVTATGANAGLTITPQNGAFNLLNGKVTLSGSNPLLTIAGQNYTVINSLQALQDMNNNLSGYYALGSDIDASETKNWNNGEGFYPVGRSNSVSNYFQGQFDGLGHTITGLTINRPNESNIGLFGSVLDGSNIKNIKLIDVNINGNHYVGGLIGELYGNDSDADKSLSGIINASSSGIIRGYTDVGGLIGRSFSKIMNSSSSAEVYARNGYAGGLIGTNYGIINSSYSSGSVDGGMSGGFVGENIGRIYNCYSFSEIHSNSSASGGFVGRSSGDIFNSYSVGSGAAGGFVGSIVVGSSGTFTNCYWDVESSKNNNAYGDIWPAGSMIASAPIGLTTSQMQQQASFTGFDFTNVWFIVEGVSYPQLRQLAMMASDTSGSDEPASPVVPPVMPDGGNDLSDRIPSEDGSDEPASPVVPDDGNDLSDRIPPEKEVIYVDGKDAIEVDLDPDNNKVIIVLDDEQAAIRDQKEFSSFINTIEDGVLESREWITERNQKIFEIYSVQGVFSSITEAFIRIGTGNPLGILESVVGFLTNSNLAKAGLNLILSEYFFHKSLESAKNAKEILHKSGVLDANEMKLIIDQLITSRVYELVGIGISMEEIDKITNVANYPFPMEVLYWSADTAKIVGENLMMFGLKLIGRAPTNPQFGVLDDGSIREIPALLTTQGEIKNMINQSMPYVEDVLTTKDYIKHNKELVTNAEGALANDGLLNGLISLRSSLDSI